MDAVLLVIVRATYTTVDSGVAPASRAINGRPSPGAYDRPYGSEGSTESINPCTWVSIWPICNRTLLAWRFDRFLRVLIVWVGYLMPVSLQEQMGLTVDFEFLWVDLRKLKQKNAWERRSVKTTNPKGRDEPAHMVRNPKTRVMIYGVD